MSITRPIRANATTSIFAHDLHDSSRPRVDICTGEVTEEAS